MLSTTKHSPHTWSSFNFVRAAALSVMTFNEVNQSSYTANASSEFVHTSPDGPIMRLAYDDKAAMMALDAFVPEDHDLTIGRVLGVTESGSVDKRTIWSSASDEGKALSAFEATFHLLLEKDNTDQIECGNTYEFYWKVDNAQSKSDAGSWKQTIDCSSKIAGNETIGTPANQAQTFEVMQSGSDYSSYDHAFVQGTNIGQSNYYASIQVNPRECSTTCTFYYHTSVYCSANSSTYSAPVYWTLTCSTGSTTRTNTCQTSVTGVNSSNNYISPCSRSNSTAFDTTVYTNTSYQAIACTGSETGSSSSCSYKFTFTCDVLTRDFDSSTTNKVQTSYQFNRWCFSTTAMSLTSFSDSVEIDNWYIYPCSQGNTTVWDKYVSYDLYQTSTHTGNSITWTNKYIKATRYIHTSTSSITPGSNPATTSKRTCHASITVLDSTNTSSTNYSFITSFCNTASYSSNTTVWASSKDYVSETVTSTSSYVNSDGIHWNKYTFTGTRGSYINRNSSTRKCSTGSTVNDEIRSYLQTDSFGCNTKSATSNTAWSSDSYSTTSSYASSTGSSAIVSFFMVTAIKSRTGSTSNTISQTTSTRTCIKAYPTRNLFIYPCTASNITAFSTSFSEFILQTATATYCTMYTFSDLLLSGSRTSSGSLGSYSISESRSFTCTTSSVGRNMFIYPCSYNNSTAFDTTYSWTTFSTTGQSTSTTTTVSSSVVPAQWTFVKNYYAGNRNFSTTNFTTVTVDSTSTTYSTRSCDPASLSQGWYIQDCSEDNTTVWFDSSVTFTKPLSTTSNSSIVKWSRKYVSFDRNSTGISNTTSSTQTRTCNSDTTSNTKYATCSTGLTTAWNDSYSYPDNTVASTSSTITFYWVTMAYNRINSTGTIDSSTYTYCNTMTTGYWSNNITYTSNECTTGNTDALKYFQSFETSSMCNRTMCQWSWSVSLCTSDWDCSYSTSISRTCQTSYLLTGSYISPCSSSNTTFQDNRYSASTVTYTYDFANSTITFSQIFNGYQYTRPSNDTISTLSPVTETRKCTTSTTTWDYLTTCSTGQKTAVFSVSTYTTKSSSGQCQLTTSGSGTIMSCTIEVSISFYTATSESNYDSFETTIYCKTTTSSFSSLNNCSPSATYTMLYSTSTTTTSCYTSFETSSATSGNTVFYKSCSFKYINHFGCTYNSSSCNGSSTYATTSCNTYSNVYCSSSTHYRFFSNTTLSHSRCQFLTTIDTETTTDLGTTICCYWNGTFSVTSTVVWGSFISSANASSVYCEFSTITGSSYTCTGTLSTTSSLFMSFPDCFDAAADVSPCSTSLEISCSSSVFTTLTSICCLYSTSIFRTSYSSYTGTYVDHECCQISFSLTYTTTSSFFTNTVTYTVSSCCRTYSTPCTSLMTLTSTCSVSFVSSTCDSTCMSTCFLGQCFDSCTTTLSSSAINVTYYGLGTDASFTLSDWVSPVSNASSSVTVSCDNTSTSLCVFHSLFDTTVCTCTSTTCSSSTCSTVTFTHGQWKDCYTTCSSGGYSTDESKDEIKSIFDGDDIGEMFDIFERNVFLLMTGGWMDFD